MRTIERSQAESFPPRPRPMPAVDPSAQAKRNHAHLALRANAAPPVPPAVEREGNEENLQQRIGKQPRLVEDDKVENIREPAPRASR